MIFFINVDNSRVLSPVYSADFDIFFGSQDLVNNLYNLIKIIPFLLDFLCSSGLPDKDYK